MPRDTTSRASARVKPRIPAFAAQYLIAPAINASFPSSLPCAVISLLPIRSLPPRGIAITAAKV
jgi:hypothetical protein